MNLLFQHFFFNVTLLTWGILICDIREALTSENHFYFSCSEQMIGMLTLFFFFFWLSHSPYYGLRELGFLMLSPQTLPSCNAHYRWWIESKCEKYTQSYTLIHTFKYMRHFILCRYIFNVCVWERLCRYLQCECTLAEVQENDSFSTLMEPELHRAKCYFRETVLPQISTGLFWHVLVLFLDLGCFSLLRSSPFGYYTSVLV